MSWLSHKSNSISGKKRDIVTKNMENVFPDFSIFRSGQSVSVFLENLVRIARSFPEIELLLCGSHEMYTYEKRQFFYALRDLGNVSVYASVYLRLTARSKIAVFDELETQESDLRSKTEAIERW